MQIDRYEVTRLLGQGAMGKVYLATDPKLDRQVAIKVLSTGRGDAEIRRRFRLEARAIAALKHPNIVELYDYCGEDAADLYLVMEYVPGLSLYHLVADRGPMSEATALCVGHELSLALEHAHTHQVVHRDIKPENILLSGGRLVLTDFGVVKAIAPNNPLKVRAVQSRTQVLGTPGFMAPEQFTGKNIDPRTDIFASGAVLYNLATGRLPFDGKSVEEIFSRLRKGVFVDPRDHTPTLSPAFCELIGKCLAHKPKDRFATAMDLRQQILDLLAVHGVNEVRQELVRYEKDPAAHGHEQRERSLDVLVRDLKVALKDRDDRMARAIIARLQVLAPASERMRDITGVGFDTQARPVFVSTRQESAGRLLAAMLFGVGLGAVAALLAVAVHAVPEAWLGALSRLYGLLQIF